MGKAKIQITSAAQRRQRFPTRLGGIMLFELRNIWPMKVFAVFAWAILSGLILLAGLIGLFNTIPLWVNRDWVTLAGYYTGKALIIVLGSIGLSWSFKWIRKNKNSNVGTRIDGVRNRL